MTDVEAALARLAERRPRIIDLSLDRMKEALRRLGNPQLKLPPVLHVAGTNGKGSTIAFMRAMLEAAGKRVHVYTSPHLVHFNERIVVAGEEIDDASLIGLLERCEEAVGDTQLTYFEATTCAAILSFAETPADFTIMEVGLGGRLDATNVFEQPLVTVATAIDIDHQQFLGETISEIAAEKAGIFRKGVPAVIGPQSPEAFAVLERIAEEQRAPIHAFGMQWNAFIEHGRMIYQDDDGLSDLDSLALLGAHQIENAGTAVAALKAAKLNIDDAVLSAGLKSAKWPGRLQRLKEGPLVDQARTGFSAQPEIWLDGGHNPHAGRAIARALADMEDRDARPLVLIAGFQANKDAAGYFASFAGIAAGVYAVSSFSENAAPFEAIDEAAQVAGIPATECHSIEDAIEKIAMRYKKEPPRVLIGGSLYLAGEVLKLNS